MTTGKFTLVIRWPSGQSTICGEMTDHQHGEICRILSPDYRAQLPSQGGEAVEVVGYRFFHVDHGYIFRRTHIYEGNPSLEAHSLMTVAQHQRILAASTHPADYERLEQECEIHKNTAKGANNQLNANRLETEQLAKDWLAAVKERDTALQLLAKCQEHLDPHRNIELRREIFDALQGK